MRDHVAAATSALDAKANGHNIAGLPRLAELWGVAAAKTVGKGLNVRTQGGGGKGAGLEDETALAFAKLHANGCRFIAQTGNWMRWTERAGNRRKRSPPSTPRTRCAAPLATQGQDRRCRRHVGAHLFMLDQSMGAYLEHTR